MSRSKYRAVTRFGKFGYVLRYMFCEVAVLGFTPQKLTFGRLHGGGSACWVVPVPAIVPFTGTPCALGSSLGPKPKHTGGTIAKGMD